jgi:hypothetical protein
MPVVIEAPESNIGPANSGPEFADENTVRALLARANLLRMRRQWDEAIAACTEALRCDPRSSAAHSLLGDIYEAQSKPEDAIQWYAMALEIDPDNASDRAKLDRLTAAQRIRLRTQDIAAAAVAPPAPKRERTLEWFDRVFPPGRSDSVARLILAMSLGFAAIMVLCTGFIYFFIVPRHDATISTTVSVDSGDVPMPSTPVLMTPSASEARTEKATASFIATESLTARTAEPPATTSEHVVSGPRIGSIAALHPANVVAVATTADPATLRTRLAPMPVSPQARTVLFTWTSPCPPPRRPKAPNACVSVPCEPRASGHMPLPRRSPRRWTMPSSASLWPLPPAPRTRRPHRRRSPWSSPPKCRCATSATPMSPA